MGERCVASGNSGESTGLVPWSLDSSAGSTHREEERGKTDTCDNGELEVVSVIRRVKRERRKNT